MLSEAQKSEFWEDGVVVVDSAYSPNELEPLRLYVERAEGVKAGQGAA